MPSRNPDDCAKHAGRHNKPNRTELDGTMRLLPKNQSGEGRAKCQYCAYEKGYTDAIRHASERIQALSNGR